MRAGENSPPPLSADRPVIVLIGDDPRRDGVENILRRRYDKDYEIAALTSDEALGPIDALRSSKRDVALVLAAHRLSDSTGIELLGQVGTLLPEAKRAVLIDWGDSATYDAIRRASALGQIDTYVDRPIIEMDEQFHRSIVELLAEWTRVHRPGFEGVRIVGDRWDPYSHGIRDALQRSQVPFGFYDADAPAGRALLEGVRRDGPLPVAILFNGTVLSRPTPSELADALGVNTAPDAQVFDLAVIGAGPAGLAAAINAASEGLRVLVVESEALGGQASASSLIRNYLGFPRGLSGSELTARGYSQAFYFGARFLIGRRAAGLGSDGQVLDVELDAGSTVRARTVIVATGVDYRRLRLASLDAFTGRGVFYGGAVSEAATMSDSDVFVVGGANSAAESALYLARFARRVTMLVRGPSLSEASDYLVREIERHPRVGLRLNSSIVDATGDYRLRSITVRDSAMEETRVLDATGVFIHIGAQPHTDWLPATVDRDARGYVRTAAEPTAAGDDRRLPLETNMAGVFAVGDVRDGSVKRVAAAVGEGSAAIKQTHAHLERLSRLTTANARIAEVV